jgi:hypothetical protein
MAFETPFAEKHKRVEENETRIIFVTEMMVAKAAEMAPKYNKFVCME